MGWKDRLGGFAKQVAKEGAKRTPAGQALNVVDALRGKKSSGRDLGEMIHLIRDLLTDDDGLVAQVKALENTCRHLTATNRDLQEEIEGLYRRVAKLEGGER